MVSHTFVTTHSHKCVQPQPPPHPKVTLSKEGCVALTTQHCNKFCQFQTALQGAWNKLDETVKTIASLHHESFQRIQNDLCMGCGMLRYQLSKLNA
jgi:hypothetical protein